LPLLADVVAVMAVPCASAHEAEVLKAVSSMKTAQPSNALVLCGRGRRGDVALFMAVGVYCG
jgi:hypothetical protein